MNFEEKVEKTEPIFHGHIMDVERETVQLPDGQTATREIVRHAPAIGILALTTDNRMILERQWRAPIGQTTLEIPAGKLDARDKNDRDSAEHAAIRELNEEVRLQPGHLERLYGFYSSVGFSDEYMTLYLATELTPVTTELPRDKGENLEVLTPTLDEALQLIENGQIEDAKTIMAIQYWQLMTKK
ncbi:NUDIX hydrolase [Levilactobacillus bambusae]|uniref:ADP-ribose pyrophosphatase n=1 Tax=Levilactobacillus bambusae TaxID=2024736 RepID=A0A2V1N2H5_9LACO|nr:NUDIX hydrolase [Levilactobacillus bambusae]PWG01103.1 ADP-ribose pyrophosphatase [Levilactobacillus bambusae]